MEMNELSNILVHSARIEVVEFECRKFVRDLQNFGKRLQKPNSSNPL